MRPVSLRVLTLLCAAGMGVTLPVAAQTAAPVAAGTAPPMIKTDGSNQVVTYQPDYFAQFQVSTALDMVGHVPGFSFSTGDSSVRGFAGAAGNVLIDGQRPAAKTGLDETLNNITAGQVDHLELIIGGAPGVDMQGYREIVNVVRKSSAKPTMTIEVDDKVFVDYPNKPDVTFTYAQNNGDHSTDFTIEGFGFRDNGNNPTKRFTSYPDFSDPHPAFMFIAQDAGGWGDNLKFDHSMPLLGGKLSVDGSYNPINYKYDALYTSDIVAREHLDYNEWPSEMGIQFERKLGKNITLDFNGLRRYDRLSQNDRYSEDSGYASQSISLSQASEDIMSAKLTWQQNDKITYKFGAESTFNRRDVFSQYSENDLAQNVPGDTVRVDEKRGEYFVTNDWQVAKTVNVETGLRVETSTISVPQSGRSQSFVYPKPKLQVVWSPRKDLKISWRTERQVGQLDFGDFASSVSLQTSVIKAGNPNLVPQKEWQNALTFDYTFWDKGALSVSFEHDALQDTLDHIAIVTSDGSIYDADGNVGNGSRDQIITSLTLPTDRLKIPGGTLKINYTTRKLHITDQITGVGRVISGQNPYDYNIIFEQNLTKIRTMWGVEIDSLNDSQSFNATEYYHYRSSDWFALYAEYKTAKGVTFSAVWQNPFRRIDSYERYAWTGVRGLSPLALQERDEAVSKPFLVLRMRKEF